MSALPAQRRAAARRRVAALRGAGLVDSVGLSLGWTVFTLHAAATQGLGAVGIYHAAMYLGIAASSPLTRWAVRRAGGRLLLRAAAGTEAVLRVAGLLLLLGGAPLPLVAGVVLLQNAVAFTGYAALRAEVAAVDRGARSLTWFGVCVAAAESLATAVAAAVPEGAAAVHPWVALAVLLPYAGALLPTWLVARGAVTRQVPRRTQAAPRRRAGAGRHDRAGARIGLGAAVILLAGGPTLLAVPLADHLAGRLGVIVAATAFMLGCLCAPAAAASLERVAPARAWPLLGVGMVLGWALAPFSLLGIVVAQLLAGMALTALEGSMDAGVLGSRKDGTSLLAHGAAARALGGAGAVALLPVLLGGARLTVVALSLAAGLVGIGLLAELVRRVRAPHGPARHVTRWTAPQAAPAGPAPRRPAEPGATRRVMTPVG